MKRMSLKKTWTHCISMYRWVSEQWIAGRRDVSSLKREWLSAHGFVVDGDVYGVLCNCFFCEYTTRFTGDSGDYDCAKCPARKIDPDFHCVHGNLVYSDDPCGFYNQLRSLHRLYKLGRKLK